MTAVNTRAITEHRLSDLESVYRRCDAQYKNPSSLALHGDDLYVSSSYEHVEVFSYATFAQVRIFSIAFSASSVQPMNLPSLTVTRDGQHILVAGGNTTGVAMFTRCGEFVRYICPDMYTSGRCRVAQTQSGELLVVHTREEKLCVFDATGTKLLTSWKLPPCKGSWSSGCDMFTARGLLYALPRNASVIYMFK